MLEINLKNVYVIAEAGVNHNADLALAFEMIEVAAAAGADAVKFQTAIPELVVTKSSEKADYQKAATGSSESQLEMIRRLHFPLEIYPKLKEFCDHKGIAFTSSAFDLTSLQFLEELGLPFHKVPSGEITNLPYLRQIGKYGRPVVLSSGMANLGEIEAALIVLEQAGMARDLVTVLHCTTEYPTPMADVNLKAMLSIHHAFGVKVGYSDHTVGLAIPIAAAALGASVIEKHFTLSRDLSGPDHSASLEPNELKAMVAAIRNIESALGDGIKQLTASEVKNKQIVRRSIVAKRKIVRGEIFTSENLIVKRPGAGISPMRWDEVLGQPATRDFLADELISI